MTPEAASAQGGASVAMRPGWRVRDVILLLPKILLTALLVIAVGDMIVGVFLRYVMVEITDWLDVDPINFFWVEEVGEYTLAWLTMIGAGIAVGERGHFTLHVLTHRFPQQAQRAIHIASHLLMAGFGALAGWYGAKLAVTNSLLTSPALELNMAWLYAAPAVGGALIVLYSLAAIFEPLPMAEDAFGDTGTQAAGDD